MGLYTLSSGLAPGWEIADHLTPSLSVFTQPAAHAPKTLKFDLSPMSPPIKITSPYSGFCFYGRTIHCFAGRRTQGGRDSSVRAVVRPDSGERGCFPRWGGGRTEGHRRGRSSRRGGALVCVRRVRRAEAEGVPFLERQRPGELLRVLGGRIRGARVGNGGNLLQAAEVHPVLAVTVNAAGASARNGERTEELQSHQHRCISDPFNEDLPQKMLQY